ncbi:response regulator transcription factor [Inhella gelatinilytica]|uniref:Response regulator transcription factor n=1 Tax=Inhella gelatinilytica TaxID=2795030 RepID=A0A931NFB1_9BURK|nr:response regulator transcription factor [Inhella gelatinilytica]MBH9553356.1 response regulator transcription factor [Inhella gelatinilytica]
MPLRALILDPNPLTRAFLVRVLSEGLSDPLSCSEWGLEHEVLTALRGGAAFDLALIDVDGPGGGLAVLDALQGKPTLKIVHTLYGEDEALFTAVQWGIDGYLLKEDRFETAVESLQRIVRGRPGLSPALARRLLLAARTSPSPRAAREMEVLDYVAKGFTPKEIGNLMGLSLPALGALIGAIYRPGPLRTATAD